MIHCIVINFDKLSSFKFLKCSRVINLEDLNKMNSLFSKIDTDNTDDFLFIISTKYLKNVKIEPINIKKSVSNSNNKNTLMKLLSIGDGEIGININSNYEDISELLEWWKPKFEFYIYKLKNSKGYKSPLDLLNLDYSLMRITYISLTSLLLYLNWILFRFIII